jgi:hypothetical protein
MGEEDGDFHLISRRVQFTCAGRQGDGFKRLQRIGNDAAANDNLTGCAHKTAFDYG